jgi:hypothetical protein
MGVLFVPLGDARDDGFAAGIIRPGNCAFDGAFLVLLAGDVLITREARRQRLRNLL